MKVTVNHRCDDFSSYRAARVKSLFNVDTGANFELQAELDLESAPWQIGVIVGPSGSGKTSMGRALWGAGLHMGDKVAGGTAYWLDDGADTGDIAAQDWCLVRPGDTAEDLWLRDLAPMGLELLSKVLGDLDRGVAVRKPQNSKLATWEPAFNPARLDGL